MSKALITVGILCVTAGVIPLAYGVFNSGSGMLLLIGTLMLLIIKKRNVLPRVLRLIAVWGLSLGFCVCAVVSALMLGQAYRSPPADEEFPVIVLGAKVREDGPSLMLARRLDTAAVYLSENPGAICVVSGGQGPDEPTTEAYAMHKYLTGRHGIDPARIFMEDKSGNTLENLSFSRALLEDQTRVVIVTDSFHQLRASIYAKKAGLDAYSVISFTPPGLLPAYWMRDILGVLYAWVFV